jgi:beta-lactamase superfamily II metal-dependent hydrolase
MLFTLEALEAKHGDALLLHFGTTPKPQLIVLDGGPAGVFNKTLRNRLNLVKAARSPNDALVIRMLMVSHIDDDHINGVLQLTKRLEELRAQKKPLPYNLLTLWHNSFDDILGNQADTLAANLKAAVKAVSVGAAMPTNLPIQRHSALVLASVKQGRELRNHAETLSLDVNEGFDSLVMVPEGQKSKTLSFGGGLSFTVLGPREARVRKLQEEWDKEIKKLGVARQAAFMDDSVFNLSSIIVLAKAGGRTMLLTGDARGDDILEGLKHGKLLKNGTCHVDLLKLPHHGSDHNVSTEFFRQVTADHYVVSGNGEHGNPELATLKMLSEARGQEAFTLSLTNEEPRLTAFFQAEKAAGKKYNVVFRKDDALSVRVDLGDALED